MAFWTPLPSWAVRFLGLANLHVGQFSLICWHIFNRFGINQLRPILSLTNAADFPWPKGLCLLTTRLSAIILSGWSIGDLS